MVQTVMRVLDRPEHLMIKFMNKSINVKQKTDKASAISFTKKIYLLVLYLCCLLFYTGCVFLIF